MKKQTMFLRLLCILCATLMLVGVLSACGDNNNTDPTNGPTSPTDGFEDPTGGPEDPTGGNVDDPDSPIMDGDGHIEIPW